MKSFPINWRPQVFAAIVVLSIICIVSASMRQEILAGTAAGGIISLATQLIDLERERHKMEGGNHAEKRDQENGTHG